MLLQIWLKVYAVSSESVPFISFEKTENVMKRWFIKNIWVLQSTSQKSVFISFSFILNASDTLQVPVYKDWTVVDNMIFEMFSIRNCKK